MSSPPPLPLELLSNQVTVVTAFTDDHNGSVPCLVTPVVAAFLIAENAVGLFTVLPTISIFFYQRLYYNATYKCIFILLLADSFAVLVAAPAASFVAVRGCDALQPLWCSLHAFVMFFTGILKINGITVLAILRLFIMTRTLSSEQDKEMSSRLADIGIVVAILEALFWALAPFFGLNAYVKDGVGCSIRWDRGPISDKIYVALLLVMEFVLPLTCVVYSYGRIVKMVSCLTSN